MTSSYRQLGENIRQRINPENIILEKAFSDELSSLSYSDVLTFIRLAMKGVEPEYTRRSKEAGEKVKTHLASLKDVKFEYQGSVMTDTHIKGYSDIDLLTISDKFYYYDATRVKAILESVQERTKFREISLEKMQREVNQSKYEGNSTEDLRRLRLEIETILVDVYQKCDITKAKSIKITNTNLKRDVDVVVANWYDDVSSIINNKGEYRGIQIYNKDTGARENPDYPFLSIKRINDRSSETVGRLKRMIRFLKNIKFESSTEIKLSSFDINGICYAIEVAEYQRASIFDLVVVVYEQLKKIATVADYRNDLTSVDGNEYIFRGNQEKTNHLLSLFREVEGVHNDLIKNKPI